MSYGVHTGRKPAHDRDSAFDEMLGVLRCQLEAPRGRTTRTHYGDARTVTKDADVARREEYRGSIPIFDVGERPEKVRQ